MLARGYLIPTEDEHDFNAFRKGLVHRCAARMWTTKTQDVPYGLPDLDGRIDPASWQIKLVACQRHQPLMPGDDFKQHLGPLC